MLAQLHKAGLGENSALERIYVRVFTKICMVAGLKLRRDDDESVAEWKSGGGIVLQRIPRVQS